MQARIADVLFYKGHQVYTVAPEATVRSAVDMMARHNVGALVVLSWRRRVIGMFSERDVLWRIAHESRSPDDTLVVEVMTREPIVISPSMPVPEAMRLMTERRIRHLPVVDPEEGLTGLISIGDLTKWVTRDLEHHVGELASYICGSPVQVANLL
jgi:CBS domain-containing protein